MKITLRTKKGWSIKVKNKDKEICDFCCAILWRGPGKNNFYCDKVHSDKQVRDILQNELIGYFKAQGAKGGIARSQSLSKEKRSEIARKASQKRWSKKNTRP